MLAAAVIEQSIAPIADSPSRHSPGKTRFERRRRFLTVLFSGCIGCLLTVTTSRWGVSTLAGETLFAMGIMLATVGCLGRLWCNLFISGRKSKDLVTVGPYSVCRNPLYFFSAIGAIGIGLASSTLILPATLLAAFGIYYPWIMSVEERRLHARHGVDFEDYCHDVPRFWPRLRSFHEPMTYKIFTRAARKNVMDAFWFLALAAIVRFISNLHELRFLPDVFSSW